MNYRIQKKHKDIQILVMDVDGTLTDGSINLGEDGELYKRFNVKDGYGIAQILPEKEILPVIITGRSSNILKIRCKELNIDYLYQEVDNKLKVLNEILESMGLTYKNVAYIGDDLNDLECMEKAALTACPNDAIEYLKNIVDYIAGSGGGQGAVREFIDWL